MIGKRDLQVVRRHAEENICSVLNSPIAIVQVPALVEGDLGLIIPCGNFAGRKGIGAIPIRVLQPRTETVRLPVIRAAKLALKTAYDRCDDGVRLARNPVRLVIVIKLDIGWCAESKAQVRAIKSCVRPVVLIPASIQSGFVLPRSRGQAPRALPEVVIRVIGKLRRCTGRVPIPGASQLCLQRARDGYRAGFGCMGCKNRRRCNDPRKQCQDAQTRNPHLTNNQSL